MQASRTDGGGGEGGEHGDDEALDALRARLMGEERAVPTSALGRLWRSGRSALAISGMLGRGGRGEELDVAGVEAIVERLGAMKGIAMKVGQMLGYVDAAVPDALRRRLAVLQTASPATPWSEVQAGVRRRFGERADALVAGLEPTPIAVASVGQVHRGRLDGVGPIALKVLHPGIADAMRADFRAAGIGRLVGSMMGAATVGEIIAEARAAFLEECDLELEAQRQGRFGELFAADPDLVVPEVVPGWAAPDALVTRWRGGRTLEAWLADRPDQAERDRVGRALYRFWLRSLYRDGLLHADPHPGNLAFADDGRVVIYDYGNVRAFPADMRRALARLGQAARSDDVARMAGALEALGGRAPRDAPARERMRELVRGFFGPLVTPGARRIALDEGRVARDVLADKKAIMRLALPGRLLFLLRLRFGLYAVLARIGAALDWSALEEAWAGEVDA